MKKSIIPALADKFVPSFQRMYWKLFNSKRAFCLCFHDVSNSDNTYAITPEHFYRLISVVKESIISIDDLGSTTKRNPIVLTFDDGFESMITVVSPYLISENVPFVCYVTTDYINREGYLSEVQLKKLSQNRLCTIGSHMCTHSKTRQMTAEQIKDEWVNSKETLQEIICKKVDHAALPYGSYLSCSEESKRIALESGYNTIANTVAAPFSRTNKEIYRYVYQNNIDRVEQLVKELSNNNAG